MGSQQLLLKLNSCLSKTLTEFTLENLRDDGMLQTIKIISEHFTNLNLSARLDLILELINKTQPELLTHFDITFILISKSENESLNDYKDINSKFSNLKSNLAAKAL